MSLLLQLARNLLEVFESSSNKLPVAITGVADLAASLAFAKESGGNLASIAANVAPPTVPTVDAIDGAAADTVLVAACATPRVLTLQNDTDNLLYVKKGTGCSSSSYSFTLDPGEKCETTDRCAFNCYTNGTGKIRRTVLLPA